MSETPENQNQETPKKWVRFDEEVDSANNAEYQGAVINAETTQVNLDKPKVENTELKITSPAVITSESVNVTIPRSNPATPEPAAAKAKALSTAIAMKNVDLRDTSNGRPTGQTVTQVGNAVIRQGFGKFVCRLSVSTNRISRLWLVNKDLE